MGTQISKLQKPNLKNPNFCRQNMDQKSIKKKGPKTGI